MSDEELKQQRLEGGAMQVDKTSVKYSSGKGSTLCKNCVHFIPGQWLCQLVSGEISPEGWCKLFDPKS